MGFVKSDDELKSTARGKGGLYEFYDAEMLVVMWESKPEIIKRLLPPPLKPTERPLVTAFLAYYPKTNFDEWVVHSHSIYLLELYSYP